MAKKTIAHNAPAESVALVSPDQAFAEETGVVIRTFLAGLAAFFTTALAIENEAKLELVAAKRLVEPTTAEEDVAMQEVVRNASSKIKAAEEHWLITTVISQFHRRMTGRRGIAIDALEEVKRIGNGWHNRYTDKKKREAQLEQDRLRREAEDKARADQEAEAARLEAEANRNEEASADLSYREQVFVERYALPGPCMGDAIKAAKSVGYLKPEAMASQLLARPKILAAIKGKRNAVAMKRQAEAVRQQPVDVGPVEQVKPDILRAPGAHDRTTWTAEVFDEAAFVRAVATGPHGIDLNVLTYKPTEVNALATKLHEALDLVPGIRAVKKTGVI